MPLTYLVARCFSPRLDRNAGILTLPNQCRLKLGTTLCLQGTQPAKSTQPCTILTPAALISAGGRIWRPLVQYPYW